MTLPSYIGEDTLSYLINACIGAAISIIVTFVVTLFLYKDPVTEEVKEEDSSQKEGTRSFTGAEIQAPLKGELKSLQQVNDGMFSEEILGQGVAIEPAEGKVLAPVNGTVTALFDTKHAIGLTSDEGIELLIHVGIDTVKLNGQGYTYHVEKGQKVTLGDLLIEFDLAGIKEQGYPTITPIVVTNSSEIGDILTANEGPIDFGEQIIKVIN